MSTEEQREVASRVFFSKCPEELRKWWDEHFTPTMSRLADESLGKGFKDAQWALNLFGVVPEHHRKGIAKAMMNAAEERAKSDVVSIVLETTTDIDVRDCDLCVKPKSKLIVFNMKVLIYKRLGFELKGETTIVSPQGQSPMWQMLKSL
ncbi:hypothetical protein DXG03_005409 [Asterophora parasitica]|uniref:N-acetyltransferase domain-containing protein n=1 Tax=Asterophora parasitica TaxID=117018 RepID=A0A9P7G894_9AGAR|nr:hypothetical protein DXG03_005409 [Asterophora parasitica]